MANNERNRLEEDRNFADFELKQLIKDEGYRPDVYRDTKNIRTMGHGFNLERPGAEEVLKAVLGRSVSDFPLGGSGVGEEDAAKLLRHELPTHVGSARNYVGDEAWDALDEETRAALVNMSFNLGGAGLRKFSGVREGLQQAASGDPEGRKKAVLNMLYIDPNLPVEDRNPTPYISQVKGRAGQLAYRMLGDLPAQEVRELIEQEVRRARTQGQVAGIDRKAGGGTVQTAKGLAALGRGPDNQLVHMAPKEVAALQRLATAAGGSLTVNPETGLVEAGFLEDWLPTIIGLGMAPFTAGTSLAVMAPVAAGLGATAVTGDWKQGLKWGLGLSGGQGIGQAFGAGGANVVSGVGPGTVAAPTVDTAAARLGPSSVNVLGEGTKWGAAPMTEAAKAELKLGLADGFLSSAPPAVGGFHPQAYQPQTLLDPSRIAPSIGTGPLTWSASDGILQKSLPLPAVPDVDIGLFSPKRWSAERWKEGMGRLGDNITSGAGWKEAWHGGKLRNPLLQSVAGGGLGMYGRSLEEFEEPQDTSDEPAGYPEDAPYGYIAPRRDVVLPQRPAGDTSEMSYFDPSPYPNPMGYVPYDPSDERFYAAGGGLVNLPKYQEGGTVAATPDAGEASYLSSFTGATDAGLPALGGGVGGGEVAYFPRRGGMGINMDITEYLESLDARGIPRMTGFSGPRAPTDLSALSGDRAWYHYPDPETQDPATNPFPLGVFYRPANQFMAGGVFTPTRPFESYTPGGSAPYDIQTETLGTISSEDKNPNTPWGSRDKTYGEYMSTQEQALRGRWPYDQYQDYMVNMSALRGGTPATPGWRNIGPMEGGQPRIPGEVYDIPVPTRAPYGFGAGILRGAPSINAPHYGLGTGGNYGGLGGAPLSRSMPTPGFMSRSTALSDMARAQSVRPYNNIPAPLEPVPARQFMAAGGPVEGAGDGTSDSVPAKIDDRQPAALSTGEFVISADVVSGLGNGDTDAGAEQLYALMDRVRSKRSNGDKQPPTLRPRGLMPA